MHRLQKQQTTCFKRVNFEALQNDISYTQDFSRNIIGCNCVHTLCDFLKQSLNSCFSFDQVNADLVRIRFFDGV